MASLKKLAYFLSLTLAVSLRLAAQDSQSFDGRSLDHWVTLAVDDTSFVRRFLVASAIRRAPPQIRQEFVRRLVPALESKSTQVSGRAVNAAMTVVNEGQSGELMEERGFDLKPAVPALLRIAQDKADPSRRAAWFLLTRADSMTRINIAPVARTTFRDDENASIRGDVTSFLGRVRDTIDLPLLLAATRDRHAPVRGNAISVLSRWQPRRALPELIAALEDSAVQEDAILALARVGPAASEAIPRLLRFIEDPKPGSTGSFSETLSANAAWALAHIIPRRGRSGLPVRVEIVDAANAVRSDGLGPYIHGADSVDVLMALSMNLMLAGPRGNARSTALKMNRPLRRSLLIDLSQPVPNSGATSLGLIRDNEADLHFFFAHVHKQNILSVGTLDPSDTLVKSDRAEIQFRINGAPHILQMGEWVQGEFQSSNATPIHGDGTSNAMIAYSTVGRWTFFAPTGSRARLWDLSDPSKPIDRGLYYLPFRLRWSLLDPP